MDEQSRFQPIILANGARMRVRPIRPDDALRLQAFVCRCSPQTIFMRANMVRPATLTDDEASYLTHVDYSSSMALVALTGAEPREEIVAVARYACSEADPREAEAAIIVEDACQQCGLGRQLMARLAAYARKHGISTLIGNVSRENGPVLGMIRGIGWPVEYVDAGWGEYQVALSLPRRGSHDLPPRAAALAARALRWPWDLPGQFAALFRGV